MEPDLGEARAKRWWLTGPRIGRIDRAARFVDDVGFALLFPKGAEMPSLWEAASERPLSAIHEDWGPDIERVWRWKDELPRRGLAWYGTFVRGRKSFLSPSLLEDLYPRSGRADDFGETNLSPDAHRIARILLRSGPQPTSALREAMAIGGDRGSQRFSAAVAELGRELVVTNLGTEREGGGWPSAILELTARTFEIPRPRNRASCRRRAAARFLDTMLLARPFELGNAFGWRADPAREVLDDLVARGKAERDGTAYRLPG